ncbi:50S ribosomal protein L11 [Patescibacteria group bacterium]|nr:50S ribosomal protein L11 [Patescibacteria group bacterium]
MPKQVKAIVKLQIQAAKANPAPPVGPALATHGLNISEFCQKFNDATKDQAGFIIPVEVTIYVDRTYTFKLKKPPASELLKKAAGIEKGSGSPNKTKVGKITKAQLREITQKKLEDLNTNDVEQGMKIIAGTAKNMGIEISE